MFNSYVVYRYSVAMCLIYLIFVSIDVIASDAPVVSETTKEHVGIKEADAQTESDQQEGMLSENDKRTMEKLKSVFNCTLVGTVISDAGKPVAIIEDNRSKVQKFYRQGDWIKGGRITEIVKDRVVIIKDGVAVELSLDSGSSRGTGVNIVENFDTEAISLVSAKTTIEASDVGIPKINREDLESIINAKEFDLPITMLDGGRLRIDDVPSNSNLNKLGLGVGDVIHTHNDQHAGVSSGEAFAQVLQQEFGENILRLEVEHQDGKPDVLYIEIDD